MICTPVRCQSKLLSTTLESYHQRQQQATENSPKRGQTTGKRPHLRAWKGVPVTGHRGEPRKVFAESSASRSRRLLYRQFQNQYQ